ncbi:MAG: hypothetical protein WC974_04865 [Thermoplasmata archaeon]
MAVYDAILFFVIISIASTIIFTQSSYIVGGVEDQERQRMIEYTHDVKDVLLKSTIKTAWYKDSDGNRTNLADNTIYDLIVEEFCLLNNGIEQENLTDGMENNINTTLRNLVETERHYLLYCTHTDGGSKLTISLSDGNYAIENLPLERYSSNWKSNMDVLPGEVDITLFIWK